MFMRLNLAALNVAWAAVDAWCLFGVVFPFTPLHNPFPPLAPPAAELTTFRTGKQAALFLARIAPRQTIEHLTYELEKQIEEEHPSLDARTPSTPQTPKARLGPGGVGLVRQRPVPWVLLSRLEARRVAHTRPPTDPGVPEHHLQPEERGHGPVPVAQVWAVGGLVHQLRWGVGGGPAHLTGREEGRLRELTVSHG